MYIRCYSWGRGDLSWSRVQERLLKAADDIGHNSVFLSTNGYENMQYWTAERLNFVIAEHERLMNGAPYDIDITYTIPTNFRNRFLRTSRVKIGRFDYESSLLPKAVSKHLNDCDYLVGSSDFVLDTFRRAGALPNKLRKINSGVDLDIFNEVNGKAERSKYGAEESTHIFLCVAEPHYRKQLDRLLDVYCSRFSNKDDVLLIIKTKIVDPLKKQAFEQDIKSVLSAIVKKYGVGRPSIKVLGGHVDCLASIYRMADVFVLPTVGEGWGMPFLEALACGNVVIAPNYGGQLEFLNDENSLLCPIYMRPALVEEQYCAGAHDYSRIVKGQVGAPKEDCFGDLMVHTYREYARIKEKLLPGMRLTASTFTWKRAAEQMIFIANGGDL